MSMTREQIEKIRFLREAFAISQEALHQRQLAEGDPAALEAEQRRVRFQAMWGRLVDKTMKASQALIAKVGDWPERCPQALPEGHPGAAKLRPAAQEHELALNALGYEMRRQGEVGQALARLQRASQALEALDAETFVAALDHVRWQCNDVMLELSPLVEQGEALFGAGSEPAATLADQVSAAVADLDAVAGLVRSDDRQPLLACGKNCRDRAKWSPKYKRELEAALADELAFRDAASREPLQRAAELVDVLADQLRLVAAALPGGKTLGSGLLALREGLKAWPARVGALLKAGLRGAFESVLADLLSAIEQAEQSLELAGQSLGEEGVRRQDLLMALQFDSLQRRVLGIERQVKTFALLGWLGQTQQAQLILDIEGCHARLDAWQKTIVAAQKPGMTGNAFDAALKQLQGERAAIANACEAVLGELRAREEVNSWQCEVDATYKWCGKDLKMFSKDLQAFELVLGPAKALPCWSELKAGLTTLRPAGMKLFDMKPMVEEISVLSGDCLLEIGTAQRCYAELKAEEWPTLDRALYPRLIELREAILSKEPERLTESLTTGILLFDVREAKVEVKAQLDTWHTLAAEARKEIDARKLLIANTPMVRGAHLLRPPFNAATMASTLNFGGAVCDNLAGLVAAIAGGMETKGTGFTCGGRPVFHTSRGSSTISKGSMGTIFFIIQSDAPDAAFEVVALGRHCDSDGLVGEGKKGSKSDHYLIGWTAGGVRVTTRNAYGRQVVQLNGADRLS